MHFRQLADFISEKINPSLAAKVDRAALLTKADLETQMVYEFPELQGIMGREYALIQGEDPVVAKAVYEHYLPTSAGGELPQTDVGAILSIADKIDTIVGFFGIGQIPTGTADPYALRRQALGVINIILDRGWQLDLPELLDKSISILADKFKRSAEDIKKDVIDTARDSKTSLSRSAAAMWLVKDPSRFDVIVTTNLFGDILSNLAAGLVGGSGWRRQPTSARDRSPFFEPVHGSAPDIAGPRAGQPVGAILDAALLLEHLGDGESAGRVARAVAGPSLQGSSPPIWAERAHA